MAILASASGPDTTDDSLPALITLALPDTGAAMKLTPLSASCLRISADSSTEIEEQSTSIFGFLAPDSRPSLPNATSLTSLPVDTMANTTSQSASSTGLSTILAPLAASGSGLGRDGGPKDEPCAAINRSPP